MTGDNSDISAAILGQESGGNPNVTPSIDGAIGQAQITPGTWAQYAKKGEDINNPADNLAVHQRILSDLSQKAGGDPARIAVGYFSGPGNIAPADSPTPYKVDHKDGNGKSVSSYVSDIMGRLNPISDAQASETGEDDNSDYAIAARAQKRVDASNAQNQTPSPLVIFHDDSKDDPNHPPMRITITNPNSQSPSASDDSDYAIADRAQKRVDAQKKAAQTTNTTPQISTAQDLLETAPSSFVKGVNAIPQGLAYGGNLVANTMGEATYGINRLMGAPKNDELYSKLTNINPFYTGNTIADSLLQSGNAIVGNSAPANPLTSGVIHEPQTKAGKYENALIMAGIAGKAGGGENALASGGKVNLPTASLPTALGTGIGSQVASQDFPGSPSAQLGVGLLGSLGGKATNNSLTPTPLNADAADIIKGAKSQFGIDTPTSAMTNGNNLVERLASKSDTQNLSSHVNKATADIMGANDNGEGHTIINQKAYLDAEKNNSAAYDKVFSDIGNVNIDPHIVPILTEIDKIGTPTFKAIAEDIQSKQNPDGTLPASAIKELTKVGTNGKSSVLQSLANQATDRPSALAAQNILDQLETAIKNKATPEQYQRLNDIDTRYKTMKTMEPVARVVGAGSRPTIPTIQNALNKSFDNINASELPPTQLSNYLNTVNPVNKTEGGFQGVGKSSVGGNALLNQSELATAIASGHPLIATLPIIQKGLGMATSKVASKYVNTNWYKNRLLNGQ